jgi:hypothetical protein
MADSMEIIKVEVGEYDIIMGVSTSNEWASFRDTLAQGIYNTYRASSSHWGFFIALIKLWTHIIVSDNIIIDM